MKMANTTTQRTTDETTPERASHKAFFSMDNSLATPKSMKTLSMGLAAALLLTGCQSLSEYDSDRASQSLSATSGELALNDTIDVRRHYARSIIQDGEVVNKPDLYTPWCTVHVYRSRVDMSNETQIESGTFSIRNIYQFIDYTASLEGIRSPWRVAGNGPLRIHEEPSNVTFSTVFELVSEQQPNVTKMVCSIFDDPRTGVAPSLVDIRGTLGELAQLELDSQSSQ